MLKKRYAISFFIISNKSDETKSIITNKKKLFLPLNSKEQLTKLELKK